MEKLPLLLVTFLIFFSCNLKDYSSHYNPVINKVTGFENVSADSGYKLGITYSFPINITPASWTEAIKQYIKEKTNVIIEIDNGLGDTANSGVVVILKNGKALKYSTQYAGYYDDSKNAYDSTAYSFRVINHFPDNNYFSYRIILQNAMDGSIFYTSETRKIYLYPTPLEFVLLPLYDTTTMFVAVNNGIPDTAQDFILYSNYPIQDFEYTIELQGDYSGVIDLGFSNGNKNIGKALVSSIPNKTNNPLYLSYPYVCYFKVPYKTYAQYLDNNLKMELALSGLKAVTDISNTISKAMPLKVVQPYFKVDFQDKDRDLGDSIYHYAVVSYNVGLLTTRILTDTINKLFIRYSFNNPVYADSFNIYFPEDDINSIGWRVGEPREFRTLQDFLDRVNFIYTKRGNDPVTLKFDINCNLVKNATHDTSVYYTFKSIVPEPQINIRLVPVGTLPNDYTQNGFISKNGSLSVFNLFDLASTSLQYTKDNGLSMGIANDNSMLQYELSWQIDDNDIINDEHIYNYEYLDYAHNKVGINISPLIVVILLDANKPLELFLNLNSNLILKNLNYGTNIFSHNTPINVQWLLRRKYDGKIWRGKESFYFQNAHIPVSNMLYTKNIIPRIVSDSLQLINTNFYDISAYIDDIKNIGYSVGGSYIMQSTDGNFVVPNPNNGVHKPLKNVFIYRLEMSYNANKVLCNIGLNAGNTSEFSKYFNSDYAHYKIWLTAEASSAYFLDTHTPKTMNISIMPYSNYLPVTMVSGSGLVSVPIYANNLVNGGDGDLSKVVDISMAIGNNKLYNGVDFFGNMNTISIVNNDVWSLNGVVLHIGRFADNGSGSYTIYVNEKTINLGNMPVQFVNPN